MLQFDENPQALWKKVNTASFVRGGPVYVDDIHIVPQQCFSVSCCFLSAKYKNAQHDIFDWRRIDMGMCFFFLRKAFWDLIVIQGLMIRGTWRGLYVSAHIILQPILGTHRSQAAYS